MEEQRVRAEQLQEIAYFSLRKEFAFELVAVEEFVFSIPKEQVIHIDVGVYIKREGDYVQVDEVDKEFPLKVYVYGSNHELLVEKHFYFGGLISLIGKADSTYTIRFYSTGSKKLVEARHNEIWQTHQVANLLAEETIKAHGEKAKTVRGEFGSVLVELRRGNRMILSNIRKVNSNISQHLIYEVVELLVCVAASFIQVNLIKKLLKQTII